MMAKEKPFHTATHRVGEAAKQKFFESPAGESPDDMSHEGGAEQDAGHGRRDDAGGAVGDIFEPVAPPSARGAAPRPQWTQEFVSRITHDLMNALGAATSFGEMLIEDLPEGDPRLLHAEKAAQGCALAMRLVKMLRDPARWQNKDINYLEAARAELHAEPQAETRIEQTRVAEKRIEQKRVETYTGHAVPNAVPHAGQDIDQHEGRDSGHESGHDSGQEHGGDAPAVQPHDSLRILVVDGRSAAADSLGQAFEAMGHKAFAVCDPQEAFKLFCETSGDWDAVICPVILRGQGGAGLLQKIKATDPQVLTVLSTGAPAPETFSPAGCDVVVESAAGAQKMSAIMAQQMARMGRRPRVRVVA